MMASVAALVMLWPARWAMDCHESPLAHGGQPVGSHLRRFLRAQLQNVRSAGATSRST
jgi:hypothetical protein